MELDKDLAARQEARVLCRQAEQAQKRLAQMDQAKLDARRQAKWEAEQAEREEREAARLEQEAKEKAEREAEEARIKAEKAISQHVGQIGEKLEIRCTYQHTGSWEQKSFSGFGTDLMHIHVFKDADGNVLTWKTQTGINLEEGESVVLKGTVKAHTEYKEEKQTVLTRCKVTLA